MTIHSITIDSTDPLPLAKWWAEALGGQVTATNDGWFVVVASPQGMHLSFQKVDDPTPGKNRIHLDLVAADPQAELAKLEKAGAKIEARHALGDFGWIVLSDPQGNVFCLPESSAAHPEA